jgi:CheY-like chemotaxis protein
MLSDRITDRSPTILVVDDSPEMRRYLRLLLELDSYHVETACNGSEALLKVREGLHPAVIVLDVQMPGMNGLKTLRHLRRLQPDLKVIMCSGIEDVRTVRRAELLGAEAYLTKPVQQLYLSAAVANCLAKSNHSSGYARNHTLTVMPSPAVSS